MLRFAGREADVVGINASLRVGDLGRHAVLDLSAERTAAKIEWVHEGAKFAGRQPDDIELGNEQLAGAGDGDRVRGRGFSGPDGQAFRGRFRSLAHSPSVLVGTTSQCCDELEARRERFGISYVQLDAGFPPGDVDALGPLVAALARQFEKLAAGRLTSAEPGPPGPCPQRPWHQYSPEPGRTPALGMTAIEI